VARSESSGGNEMGQTAFRVALLKIMWINVLAVGDNAVVIAMPCATAQISASAGAWCSARSSRSSCRIHFTGVVASLMLLAVREARRAVSRLFYIAAQAAGAGDPDADETEATAHLSGGAHSWPSRHHLSLDNVIAIAAAAAGANGADS